MYWCRQVVAPAEFAAAEAAPVASYMFLIIQSVPMEQFLCMLV
jgi:hypothetical protein